MALDDTKSQDYLVNIINQGLVNKEEGRLANQQENENIIDHEIEDNEFKFHKEFPNIYSQSDSVFDIGRNVPQNIRFTNTYKDKMKIRIDEQEVISKAIDEQNVEEVSNFDNTISERRSDEDLLEENKELEKDKESGPQTNFVEPDESAEIKKRKRRKRRRRPFDGRENWEKLNEAIFGEVNNTSLTTKTAENTSKVQENTENQTKSDIGQKKKRRRKRKKGGKRKQDVKKTKNPKPTFHLIRGKSTMNFKKPSTIHLARPMPKIQLRGRPLNLQSFLNIF